jgi:hypothetical protein
MRSISKQKGNEVLNLGSFTLLPQHVVRLILARDELQADEFTKFQAALMWSKKFCDSNPVSCCYCFIADRLLSILTLAYLFTFVFYSINNRHL